MAFSSKTRLNAYLTSGALRVKEGPKFSPRVVCDGSKITTLGGSVRTTIRCVSLSNFVGGRILNVYEKKKKRIKCEENTLLSKICSEKNSYREN